VTFEGYAEHFDATLSGQKETRNAVRLCRVSQELVSSASPITITIPSNDGASDQYQMVFDLLNVPGWLPSSTEKTVEATKDEEPQSPSRSIFSSIKYSIFATVSYRIIQSSKAVPSATLSYFLQTCAQLWSSTEHTAQADPVDIEVIRYCTPELRQFPACRIQKDQGPRPQFPLATYIITAKSQPTSPIPNEIIAKLQIQVLAPSIISNDEIKFPISVAFRLIDARESCSQTALSHNLAVTRVEIYFDQEEEYFSQPETDYTSRFPLPTSQPPQIPLYVHKARAHTPRFTTKRTKWSHIRSLLREDAPSCFCFHNEGGLSQKGHTLNEEWSIVNLEVTLDQAYRTRQGDTYSTSKHHPVSTSFQSPFLHISHSIVLSLHLLYDNNKEDTVKFSLPVRVIRLQPNDVRAQTPTYPHFQQIMDSSHASLPPYSQLFYENGEEKIYESDTILPRYSRTNDGYGSGDSPTLGFWH
jgi:hypothetical protein